MKKKLLQEQKEKAIIESFAKTFNKIKRLNENPVSGIVKEFGDVSPEDFQIEEVMRLVSNAINSITSNEDDRDMLFNAFERTITPEADTFAIADKLSSGKITVEDIPTIVANVASTIGLSTNGPVDEINLKKGLATLGLAASMMGAPKDATAQMPQQQGIEKSISSASALGLPQDNRKAGKVVIDSYTKNPFTAEMWSEKSRENLRFFKTIKKLVNYYSGGGQVDDTDIEELGAMAKQSPVVMDFLQR